LVLAGFALLIWLPSLRCPPAATVVAGTVAEASLCIYLTHFQVYPLFVGHPLLGVIASLVAGVLLTQLVSMLRRSWSAARAQHLAVRTPRTSLHLSVLAASGDHC
jgi:hypothetical protein